MKSMRIVLAGLLLVAIARAGFSQALPGLLDPGFGVGGFYTFIPGGVTVVGLANGIAVQGNGKIIFSSSVKDGFDDVMVVTRLTEGGGLDLSFAGGTGFSLPPIPIAHVFEPVLAIQPDQKVLCGAWAEPYFHANNADFVLTRLDAEGKPDPSFKTAVTDIYTESYDVAEGLAVLPDGSIIQAGFTYTQWPGTDLSVFSLVKYLPDGQLDSTFDSDGILTLFLPTTGAEVHKWIGTAVAAQSDGKMVVAGYGVNQDGASVAAVFRLLPDGNLDPTFNAPNGYQILYGFGGPHSSPSFWAIAIQPDGSIVLAGNARSTSIHKWDAMVVRLLPDGSFDPAFGLPAHPGIAVLELGSLVAINIRGVAIDHSGHYYVAGAASGQWFVGCFDSTGVVAPGFGPTGLGYGLYGNNLIHAMAIDSSNRIVLAGDHGMTTIKIARLTNYVGTLAPGKIRLPLQVWPNPTNGAFQTVCTVREGGPALYRVTDLSGQILMEYHTRHLDAGEQQLRFDLGADLPPGLYWLNVETKTETGTTAFVIY